MSMNRRQFLKIAGVSTVLGLGGATVINGLRGNELEASHVLTDEKALNAKRWAMVIDISKFRTEEDYKGLPQYPQCPGPWKSERRDKMDMDRYV